MSERDTHGMVRELICKMEIRASCSTVCLIEDASFLHKLSRVHDCHVQSFHACGPTHKCHNINRFTTKTLSSSLGRYPRCMSTCRCRVAWQALNAMQAKSSTRSNNGGPSKVISHFITKVIYNVVRCLSCLHPPVSKTSAIQAKGIRARSSTIECSSIDACLDLEDVVKRTTDVKRLQ